MAVFRRDIYVDPGVGIDQLQAREFTFYGRGFPGVVNRDKGMVGKCTLGRQRAHQHGCTD